MAFSQGSAPKAFRGAVASVATQQVVSSGVNTILNFDAEIFDTDGIHDVVTNDSRLTVPAGVTKVRLTAQTFFGSINNTLVEMEFRMNGAANQVLPQTYSNTRAAAQQLSSGVLTVTGGDYFEVAAMHNHGSNQNATDNRTWFSMEIIG